MKAELIADCSINGQPKKKGDIVEVDQNTFDNLVRKGLLKAATAEVKKITKIAAPKAEQK